MLVRPPSPPYTVSFAIHSIFWTILCVIPYIGIGPWPPLSFYTRYQLPFCTICALIHFHFSWCSSCTSVYLTLKFDTSPGGPIDGNFEVGAHDMSGRDAGQSALPVADCEGIVGLGAVLSSPFFHQDAAFPEETSETETLQNTGTSRERYPSNHQRWCRIWQGSRRRVPFKTDPG